MLTLVTGATGYLGTEVVRLLGERKRPVRALARSDAAALRLEDIGVEVARGDVTGDADQLARAMAGVERVFHLAGVVAHRRRDEARLRAVNVEGARRLLAAAATAGVGRVVFTSSVAAVGPAPSPKRRLDERSWLSTDAPPEFRYATSKLAGERVAQEAAAAGLDVVVVNPGFVIGPGDVNRVSSWTVEEYLRGALRFTVDGGLSYVDARDVAAGHLLAEQHGVSGRRYILTNDEGNLSYRQFFDRIAAVTGTRRRTLNAPVGLLAPLARAASALRLGVPTDDQELRSGAHWWYTTAARARDELGFTVRPLDETIADTVAWLRADGYHRH
ncbi:MAG TPA: NAD-dependent epimerase/dehydratase family protein [Gaiellales bacterium]|nr:NAD-dependent epimerase/dehydratase family protein [Gaiellales bacterium]